MTNAEDAESGAGSLTQARELLSRVVTSLDGYGVVTNIVTNEDMAYLSVRIPRDSRLEAEITINPGGYCEAGFWVPVGDSHATAAKILAVLAVLAGTTAPDAAGAPG